MIQGIVESGAGSSFVIDREIEFEQFSGYFIIFKLPF